MSKTFLLLALLAGALLWAWASPATAQNPPPTLPPTPTYSTTRAAFFPFERGLMFWLEDVDRIYVLANVSEFGGFARSYVDLWEEGMPETDPARVPPAGFSQPDRGFGLVWRTYPAVQSALGWGVGGTHGYTALVVRDGDRVLISCPNNRVYEIDGGTWHFIDYYYKTP